MHWLDLLSSLNVDIPDHPAAAGIDIIFQSSVCVFLGSQKAQELIVKVADEISCPHIRPDTTQNILKRVTRRSKFPNHPLCGENEFLQPKAITNRWKNTYYSDKFKMG